MVVNSRSHLSDGAVFLKYKKMKNVNPLLQFFYNTLQIVNGFGGTYNVNTSNLNNRALMY